MRIKGHLFFVVFLGFVALGILSCGGSEGSTTDEDAQEEDPDEEDDSDDTSDPGLPAAKISYSDALTLPSAQGTIDHYDFLDNPDDYTVVSEDLHGTEVSVAVHQSNISAVMRSGYEASFVTDAEAQTWAESVRDCWHEAWHVFGGYRYDKFAVLVRSSSSEEENFSLSEAGVSINADQLDPDDDEFVCHELLHSWLGKLIAHQPDGTDNLFQRETWLSEGGVVYYSLRLLGDIVGEEEYTSGMDERFEDYDEARGTALDLSIQELADLIGQDTSHEGVAVLYARGALISFLLDQELVDLGFSMDDLLASLYENFGLADIPWTQDDLEAALQEITATDFSDFFDTNLETNATLDVEGSFNAQLEH